MNVTSMNPKGDIVADYGPLGRCQYMLNILTECNERDTGVLKLLDISVPVCDHHRKVYERSLYDIHSRL